MIGVLTRAQQRFEDSCIGAGYTIELLFRSMTHLRRIGRKRRETLQQLLLCTLGSMPVVFLHDEILFELPEEDAHERAEEAARLMREAMEIITPDVRVTAVPALMKRWHKDAEPVYEDGRLVPWTPDEED